MTLLQEDGWDTEPFELTEKDGRLFGRGSTDDKGPVLCTLHAIEAYRELKKDIPVNIKVPKSKALFTLNVCVCIFL